MYNELTTTTYLSLILFIFSDVCLWCKRLWYCLKNKICRSTTNKQKQKTPKKVKSKNAVVVKQKLKTY